MWKWHVHRINQYWNSIFLQLYFGIKVKTNSKSMDVKKNPLLLRTFKYLLFLLLHKTRLTRTQAHMCTFQTSQHLIKGYASNSAEICMIKIQSASAIKGRTFASPATITQRGGTQVLRSWMRKIIAWFSLLHHRCNQHAQRRRDVGSYFQSLCVCARRRWLWAGSSGNWVHIQMHFSSSSTRSY